MDLPPLNLGYTQFLPDLIRLNAGTVVTQRAGPPAHVEGKVLTKPGLLADILEQVFEAAWGPGEELVDGVILIEIFPVNGQPIFGQVQLALLVAAGRAGVNVQLVPAAGGIVLRFAFSVVIENVGQAEVL